MKGWYKESYRHSLASKGIKTSLSAKRSFQPVDEERLRLINLAILASPEREDELVAEGLRAEQELISKMNEDFTKWMPEIAKGDFILEMKSGDYFIFRLVGVTATGPVWRSTMPGLEDIPILLPEVEGIIKSLYPMGIYDIKATEARSGFAGKINVPEGMTVKEYFRRIYGDDDYYDASKRMYVNLNLTDEQIDNLILDDERMEEEKMEQTLKKGGSFDEVRLAEGVLTHKKDILQDIAFEKKRKALKLAGEAEREGRLNKLSEMGFFVEQRRDDLTNEERLNLYREPDKGVGLPKFTEVGKKPVFTSTTTLNVKEGEYD